MSSLAPTQPFVLQRAFAASPVLLWRAWTEAEQLQQWFGPTGTTMFSCHMVFRPGGHCHYGLRMPNGQTIWGLWAFRVIVPFQTLVMDSSFSDAERGVARHPMEPVWPLQTLSSTTFEAHGDGSRLTLHWVPLDASEAECAAFNAAHASMNQGWGGTLDRLDAYLAKLK